MPVYFVQAVDGGAIKIGHSADVDNRVKQLEVAYGRPLALLGTMPGGRDEEREIHERFSHLRFGRSEQFRPESDLLAFIGRPLFVSATPVVEAMVDRRSQIILVVYKADPERGEEYKAWLEGLAEHTAAPLTVMIDQALQNWAKVKNYVPPPKRLR